jgi:hypothetical protein
MHDTISFFHEGEKKVKFVTVLMRTPHSYSPNLQECQYFVVVNLDLYPLCLYYSVLFLMASFELL